MIERHPMADAAPAIMPDHGEPFEAEVPHHFDLILPGGALGISGMIFAIRRLAAVAIAAQIGRDYGELFGQSRRDLVPLGMRLRESVQQQDWRAAAGRVRRGWSLPKY